jgi:hypothetical protein
MGEHQPVRRWLAFSPGGWWCGRRRSLGERFRRVVVQFDGNGVATDRSLQSDTCISGFWGIDHASEEFGGHCLPPLPDTGSRLNAGLAAHWLEFAEEQ